MVGKLFTASIFAIALSLLLLAFPGRSSQATWFNSGGSAPLSCDSGSCTGTNPYAPGETADIVQDWNWANPSANFAYGYIVSFLPVDWYVAPYNSAVLGDKAGDLDSTTYLGLFNTECDNYFPIHFDLYVSNTNISETFQVDPDMKNVDDDDEECYPGAAGNGIMNIVDCYPHFNNIMFDPDGDGPKAPLKPRARLSAMAIISGEDVPLQFLTFNPGQLQMYDPPHPYSQFASEWGYPSVIILMNPTEPSAASAISSFCTPVVTQTNLYGKSEDPTNPAVKTSVMLTNPDAGTGLRAPDQTGTDTHLVLYWGTGLRDIDAWGVDNSAIQMDEVENGIDTCPLVSNLDDMRLTKGADAAKGDMIDPVCDPNPAVEENGGDYDGDGYKNANDNCPLVANPFPQTQTELNMPPPADAGPPDDAIGDACEVSALGDWAGGDWDGDGNTTDPYEQYLNRYYVQGHYHLDLQPAPITLGPDTDPEDGWPDNDADKDGWSDAAEIAYGSNPNFAGSGDHDGDTIPNVAGMTRCDDGQTVGCSDNCPIDYNPNQHDTWGIARIGDVCEMSGPVGYDSTSSHAGAGTADYDMDGLNNDDDPCPQHKSDTRPGGAGADADGDGIGDTCDPLPAIDYAPFGQPEHKALEFAVLLNDVGATPDQGEKPPITQLHLQTPDLQPPTVDPLVMDSTTKVPGSTWHELWPYWSRTWTITAIDDNTDGILSPSDQITVDIDDGIHDDETGDVTEELEDYHVDEVTVTIEVCKEPEHLHCMTLEFEGGFDLMQDAIHNPEKTQWLEKDSSYRTHAGRFQLKKGTWNDDNDDNMLSASDQIVLEDRYVQGQAYEYHVDRVTIDITVTKKHKYQTGLLANPGMDGVEQLCDDYIDNDWAPVDSGIAEATTATTLTDNDKSWGVDEHVGRTVTSASSKLVVTSNTATVLTGTGGWVGPTPAPGAYTIGAPVPADTDLYDAGCGDLSGDSDDDGLLDSGANKDNCKWARNQTQRNTDGDAEGDACDADDDGDTLLDAYEWALGTDPLDAASTGGASPTTDTDNDDFSDNLEYHMGTDPTSHCPGATDAWPPDVNVDGIVNVQDTLSFSKAPAVSMTFIGTPNFDRRYDLDGNNAVGVTDILNYTRPGHGVQMTECKTLAFRNNPGGDVDGIHVEVNAPKKFKRLVKAWDDDGVDWTFTTTATFDNPNVLLEAERLSDPLAANKQVYIAVIYDVGASVNGANSYWILDDVNQGALGTVMERTSVMLRNDTQGPVDDVHLELTDGKNVYRVFSAVDGDAVETTLTAAAPAGANTIDVDDATGFHQGDTIEIGAGGTKERNTITLITGNTFTLGTPLQFAHAKDEPVVRAWTCTDPGAGANAIDCERPDPDGDLEYKGILTIEWKIDFKASIDAASSYWTLDAANKGPVTIIKQ